MNKRIYNKKYKQIIFNNLIKKGINKKDSRKFASILFNNESAIREMTIQLAWRLKKVNDLKEMK